METPIDGVVVKVSLRVNNVEAISFVVFETPDGMTQTLKIGGDERTEKMFGFLLLLCGSKCVRGLFARRIETLLTDLNNDIIKDHDLQWLDDLPF